MRINTNVPAINTQRILSQTNTAVQRSIGRLSSGFRINRAADDAAGLGIANRLRADVRGLQQAARNAEQANSVLQIAEGATQTIQGIVERMKELAVQAASDNVSDAGRAQIDAEFTQLQEEISRIVTTTKFQGSTLLDGSFGNQLDTGAASTLLGVAGVSANTVRIDGAAAGTYTLSATADSVTLTDGAGNAQTIGDVTVDGGQGAQTWRFDQFGIEVTTTDLAVGADLGDLVVTDAPVTFMVSVSGEQGAGGGAGADDVTLGSLDLSLATLGINADSLADKAGAQTAIGNIDTALDRIAEAFGSIGAAQNRIDFATANVRTMIENVAAAESTIRDADMAAEMTEFTRNQILQQAGTAMLAQANAAPQMVLRLLQ